VDSNDLINLFKLPASNRKLLDQQLKQVTFEHSGPVIHKGQEVSGAYLVMQGKPRVFTYCLDGTEATLYFLQPGEICVLTLNCLFNNFRYPAWVEASANSSIALIPGALFQQLFKQETSIQEITVKALSTLVFRLMDTLEGTQTCTLDQRLARFILNHASSAGKLKMTQQEIANHLGTTREVIARLMQTFKAKGMVITSRGNIVINNETLLVALVSPSVLSHTHA
jgi:CRP/FNR family transcriptional regulator